VNVDVYEMLLGMGYPKGASAEALRQANNDLNLALEVNVINSILLGQKKSPDPKE
jgi:hypothetical protein